MDSEQWALLDLMPLNAMTKPLIIGHMNGSYKALLNAYLTHFCGQAGSQLLTVTLMDLDECGLTLQHYNAEAEMQVKTIRFCNAAQGEVRVTRVGALRRCLLDMAKIASEGRDLELELPPAPSCGSHECEKVPGAYLLNAVVSGLECLNQDDAHPITNVVRTSLSPDADGARSLLSDAAVDHQLLIKIGFRQPVRLKAITIRASTDDATAPQLVKIFQGQPSIGFQEAEEDAPLQILELSADQLGTGDPLPLRVAKFQCVTTLQMFMQENFGAEVTRIDALEFWGSLAETVDMKAWKPVKGDASNPEHRVHMVFDKDEGSGPV